jgi:phosphatidylserine/phosphatidylglycerophosphate/cardiolipin synthase-like enzyme
VRARAAAAVALAAAVLAGCGGGGEDKSVDRTATTESSPSPNAPPATARADTPLVRCLTSQSFIHMTPGPAGELIVTAPKSGDRAIIRTYDSLSDALRAGHRAGLDLDQIISRQTIQYGKGGTGQIKIAVETCQ